MPLYQNSINYDQFKRDSSSDYDLAAEKQRIEQGTKEIKKELWEKWQQRYSQTEKFPSALASLNPTLISFLLKFENTLFYNSLAQNFRLNQEQRAILPQIVWQLCLRQRWSESLIFLEKNLSLPTENCQKINLALENQFFSPLKNLSGGNFSEKSAGESFPKKPELLKISFSQALKDIPEIGEQAVTSERIRVLNFPEPVRPSVKNWLADYTSFFGYSKPGSLEFGNYIFHSENTKKLSSTERSKIAYILKSFHDDSLVSVNKSLRQIIFPALPSTPREPVSRFENKEMQQKTSIVPEPKQNTRLSFSSPQKLPYEKELDQPLSIANLQNSLPKKNPLPRPIGKNVVNLREE